MFLSNNIFDYRRTQDIGRGLAGLPREVDGPDSALSALCWSCDNLTIFTANHLAGRLELIDVGTMSWRAWARENGIRSPK